MNPRPLGYELYDARLWRLGLSRAGMVAWADRTDPISLCRPRLPVSPGCAASGLQIGLQDTRLIYGSCIPRVSAIARLRSCHGEHDEFPAAADLERGRSLPKKPAADVSHAAPPRTYG